jgi:hypothetical protein
MKKEISAAQLLQSAATLALAELSNFPTEAVEVMASLDISTPAQDMPKALAKAEDICFEIVIFRRMLAGTIAKVCGAVTDVEADRAFAIHLCSAITEKNYNEALARLGGLVAQQVKKGNHSILSTIGSGMDSMDKGQAFVSNPGRKPSTHRAMGIVAFHALKTMGVESPSQSEFRQLMDDMGCPMSKPATSKLFDEMKWKNQASDARQNASPSGKRRIKEA